MNKALVVLVLLLTSTTSFSQQSTAAMVTYTATFSDVTLRNSGAQPILALLVTVKGQKAMDVYEHDFFFKDMQFDPGQTLEVGMDNQFDASDVRSRPVTVVWYQCADGTQWGDLTEGGKMLAQRAATETLLTNLNTTTDDQTFLDLLNTQLKGKRNTMMAIVAYQLRQIATLSGVAAARTEVRDRIRNGGNRRTTWVTGTVRSGGRLEKP